MPVLFGAIGSTDAKSMVHLPERSVEEVRSALGVPELEELVRAVDPTAVLVPSRILRRVIKHDTNQIGLGLRVPHRKTYVISRDLLLAIVDRFELDLPPDSDIAETVVLLARPSPQTVAMQSRDALLLKYW